MEAVLQARSRDAGAARFGWLSARPARVVAGRASRVFAGCHCDDRAVAVDADRHQAYQRFAAGNGSGEGWTANQGADGQMGRNPWRAYGFGGARNRRFFLGLPVALDLFGPIGY